MRALLRGERRASPLVVLGFVAVVGVAAYFLVQATSWRNQFFDLKRTIYTRCQQRDAYDRASQQARAAQLDYYQRLLINLQHHPSPQTARFNADLTRSARRVARQLQHALDTGAPRGCSAYR